MREPQYMSLGEAMALTRQGAETLHRWRRKGLVVTTQTIGKRWLFERESVLKAMGITPEPPKPEPSAEELHQRVVDAIRAAEPEKQRMRNILDGLAEECRKGAAVTRTAGGMHVTRMRA